MELPDSRKQKVAQTWTLINSTLSSWCNEHECKQMYPETLESLKTKINSQWKVHHRSVISSRMLTTSTVCLPCCLHLPWLSAAGQGTLTCSFCSNSKQNRYLCSNTTFVSSLGNALVLRLLPIGGRALQHHPLSRRIRVQNNGSSTWKRFVCRWFAQ